MGDSAKPSNIKIPGDSLAEMLTDKKQLETIAPLIANVVKIIDDKLINKIQELFIESASNNEPLKNALTELHKALKSFYKPPESPRQPRAGDGLLRAPQPTFIENYTPPRATKTGPLSMGDTWGGGGRRRTKNAYFYNKRRKTRRRKGKK